MCGCVGQNKRLYLEHVLIHNEPEVSEVLGFCSDCFNQANLGTTKLRSQDLRDGHPVLKSELLLSKALIFVMVCFLLLVQQINEEYLLKSHRLHFLVRS